MYLGHVKVLLGMFLSLKTLYRKRTVIWPFYFYTIIRTLSFELNEVSDYITVLINKLISHYKEDYLVNFIDINENKQDVFKSRKVGLLEGELGVYLTLMTLKNTKILNEKNWTNAFLIS
ncbi:lanthionine synthetase C-like family protein [Staphylococcus aureus]|nr:lanthionine synthetase C-like family protein [Staphylococcus aureus]